MNHLLRKITVHKFRIVFSQYICKFRIVFNQNIYYSGYSFQSTFFMIWNPFVEISVQNFAHILQESFICLRIGCTSLLSFFV